MTQCHIAVAAEAASGRHLAADNAPHQCPRNPIEETIAQIWATVLGVETVDIHDNFLLLGGESLMATQVATEVLSRLNVEVPIRSILVGTVAEVSEEVSEKLKRSAG